MSFEQIKDNFLNVILNHYADFNGRARRSEYWYFTLVNVCISLVLSLLQQITGWNLFAVLSGLVSLALLVPGLGLAWRRLHDIGKSGTNWFWVFLPIVGWIMLLVWLIRDGERGPNQYGPDPKDSGTAYTGGERAPWEY